MTKDISQNIITNDHLNGGLVISLDFELYWGIRDKYSLEDVSEPLEKVHNIVPRLLALFTKNDIHCTWATVGYLFAKNQEELISYFPNKTPQYKNDKVNPYSYIKSSDLNKNLQQHFAPALIESIIASENQEIGTHSFSHYYCLEKGQDHLDFSADLTQAKKISLSQNIIPKSFVFPRNQFSEEYLSVLTEKDIYCYRGNEQSFIYHVGKSRLANTIRRAFRLIDRYINLSGHHSYKINKNSFPINIPASRFLSPYNPKYKKLEKIKLRRIKESMEYAAKNNEFYHLWWHPHNFSKNTEENIYHLKDIIDHFQGLKKKYGFQSYTMSEAANS